MNANVIEFYKKVRADKGLIEALSEGKPTKPFPKSPSKRQPSLVFTWKRRIPSTPLNTWINWSTRQPTMTH